MIDRSTGALGYVHTIPVAFASARNPYLIGLLFTHKNGDFGAISVTERSCAALIFYAEGHISDRCSQGSR